MTVTNCAFGSYNGAVNNYKAAIYVAGTLSEDYNASYMYNMVYSENSPHFPPLGVHSFYVNDGYTGIFTGNTTAGGLPDFLLGTIDNSLIGAGDTLTEANLRTTNWFFYAQDDWRATDRLTLNLGLRWEYETAPSEKTRMFSRNLDLGIPIPELQGGVTMPAEVTNIARIPWSPAWWTNRASTWCPASTPTVPRSCRRCLCRTARSA